MQFGLVRVSGWTMWLKRKCVCDRRICVSLAKLNKQRAFLACFSAFIEHQAAGWKSCAGEAKTTGIRFSLSAALDIDHFTILLWDTGRKCDL